MSSFIFYRFKSQKEPSRISFDGLGISVWELKKEIIQENKMGKGTDFDFAIYNEHTEEEYADDHATVPRSTSILARRLPPSKPGRGTAQKYVAATTGSGTPVATTSAGAGRGAPGQAWKAGSMSKRFDGKEDKATQEPAQVIVPAEATGDEASAMAAMFAASSQQWQQTQEQMAAATHIAYRGPSRAPRPPRDPNQSGGGGGGDRPEGGYQKIRYQPGESTKPPPVGYICYRCGQKGHWIQDCPTNSDKAFDDRPKIKRTTGIPKSFLTTVEGPGSENVPTGVMVTAEGGFVIAKPDNASWLAHRAITKNLSATDVQNLAPTDPDLTCPICSKLLREATLTPCCSTSFCNECVVNHLSDNDMLCPECETRVKNLEKLIPDEGRRERVKKYIEEVVEASKEAEELEEGEEKETEAKEGGDLKMEEKPDAESVPVAVSTPMSPKPDAPVSPTVSAAGSKVASPPREGSATPLPTAASSRPALAHMSAAQQAQMIRQQQLQQQRAMAMMQGGMGMTPAMVQQQIFQLQMTLQNPQIHPMMRQNLLLQLQNLQGMAMQMGMMAGVGGQRMGVGAGSPQANFGGVRNGMSPNPAAVGGGRSPMGNGTVPTGPRAGGATPMNGAAGKNDKRPRPEDFAAEEAEAKSKRMGALVEPPEIPVGPPA